MAHKKEHETTFVLQAQDCPIKLGTVGRPHGVRGAFFVSHRSESFPKSVKRIWIGNTVSTAKMFEIVNASQSGGRPTLNLKDFQTRDHANQLIGQTIWCDREQLGLKNEDEFLITDLLQKSVFDVNGSLVGVISDSYHTHFGQVNVVILHASEDKNLDLTFSGQYFDMTFTHDSASISLIVSKDIFEEIWNDNHASAHSKKS